MSEEYTGQGRYSLTGVTTRESGPDGAKKPYRAPGSTGRCRTLDMTWLLSLRTSKPRKSIIEENKIIDDLKLEGFTVGLARTLMRNTEAVAVRVWLIDNSGSLNNTDGHVVVRDLSQNKIRNVACTRWEEVTNTLLWHAEFNAKMGAPMVIRMVNDPGSNVGPQQLGVAASKNVNVDGELQRLRRLLKCHPGGCTPLTVHLKDILASLRQVDSSVLQDKMISIIIVTDRLPADAEGNEGQDINFEFLETLKAFHQFPVWIVVRLSTDEKRVVNFYSSLDRGIAILRQLRGEADHARVDENIRLDVLDDFVSEAARVEAHNPWLNYALPLHLTRESGSMFSAFDAINERPLDYDELADFVALLFDRHATLEGEGGLRTLDEQPLANPQSNYREFRRSVQQLAQRNGDLWNPVKKRMQPWINLRELDRIYACGRMSNTTDDAASCSCQIS